LKKEAEDGLAERAQTFWKNAQEWGGTRGNGLAIQNVSSCAKTSARFEGEIARPSKKKRWKKVTKEKLKVVGAGKFRQPFLKQGWEK